MPDIKWIKITTDIFDDEKILLIETMPDADSMIVVWFKLLALAGKSNNNGVFMLSDKIPYTDEMLAAIFRRPLNTVRAALDIFEQFGMIERIDGVVSIKNWNKHQNVDGMERIREQGRKRVAGYRERKKLESCNVTGNVTVTQCNAIDKDKEKERDKDKEREREKERDKNENARARKVAYSIGSHGNVLMTENELDAFRAEYDNADTMIENLSEYLYQHPDKHYADHASMLRKWATEDAGKAKVSADKSGKSVSGQTFSTERKTGDEEYNSMIGDLSEWSEQEVTT